MLIVKDTRGEHRKDLPGLIGMNIISECMDIFQSNIVNTDVKGFACVAGNNLVSCVGVKSIVFCEIRKFCTVVSCKI